MYDQIILLWNHVDGKSEEIRRAAAEQIASVATNQPGQLFVLLAKITETLLGKRWEGRTAASYCLELIAKHCEHHTVESMKGSVRKSEIKVEEISGDNQSLSIHDLDIHDVIQNAKILVASEGAEFSIDSLQDQQTLQQQKKHLKSRLGLDGLSGQLVSTDDFIADEDFEINVGNSVIEGEGKSVSSLMESRLSARERAMLRVQKRKHGNGKHLPSKKQKVNDVESRDTYDHDISQASIQMWDDAISGMWPFQRLSDKLCVDLLHPCWETRHGAALGLRAILRYHSRSAGIFACIEDIPTGWMAAEGRGRPTLVPMTEADVERAIIDNRAWVEECATHLLCVLALDRFGDYTSDGVIAPVRETAAQVLGIVAATMNDDLFSRTIKVLSDIVQSKHWEPRHGAISALKYILAARGTLSRSTVLDILAIVRTGLGDLMEDVRSVSAECLIPCVDHFTTVDNSETQAIIEMLWNALLSLDPINVATKSASKLLECLFMHNVGEQAICNANNVPRLWYHFSSTVPSIRVATIQCYHAIVKSGFGFDAMPLQQHLAGLFSCLQVVGTDDARDIANIAAETAHSLIDVIQGKKEFFLDQAALHAVIEVALFASGKEFVRPPFAALPDINELVDREELSSALYVPKEISSERRFLICGIAAAIAGTSPKLENSLVQQSLSLILSTNGLKKQVGSMVLLNMRKRDISQLDNMHEVLKCLNEALAEKQILDEFRRPYESLAQNFAKIGVCNIDFMAQTVNDLKLSISKDQWKDSTNALVASFAHLKALEENFALGVLSLLASAVIQITDGLHLHLPEKLNCMIQPLIGAIRREKDEFLQGIAAEYLADLVWLARNRNPSPSSKIIKNMCLFACADRSQILDLKALNTDMKTDQATERPISSAAITSRVCFLCIFCISIHIRLIYLIYPYRVVFWY